MFFDARAAKLLKPGEHLVVDGCLGLRLVVSASRKTWTYRYKAPADGRMKQLALGQWPATPVQAAAALWDTARAQRAAGIDPGQARRLAVGKIKRDDPADFTVRQVLALYIAGHLEANRKAAGAAAAGSALNRLLAELPAVADRPGASITRADAFEILDARKATPTSTAKLRSMLGGAWDYALDAGKLPPETPNWWRMIMKGRLKSKGKIVGGVHVGKTRRSLRAAEVGQLLAWAPNMHLLGRDATEMYLWTCARGSEILGLRAEHVCAEPDGWWWTVPKDLTKNARYADAVDLRIPLFGRALEIVQRRLASVGESGWLFEDGRGEQYEQKDFSTYIYSLQPYSEKVARRSGDGLVIPVTGWTPHNLRRTSRTLLASLGCSDQIGEAILGHLPPGEVGTYNSHTYDAERRLWLGNLSERLGELALQAQASAGLLARP